MKGLILFFKVIQLDYLPFQSKIPLMLPAGTLRKQQTSKAEAPVKGSAGRILSFSYVHPNSPIPWTSKKLLLPKDTGLK